MQPAAYSPRLTRGSGLWEVMVLEVVRVEARQIGVDRLLTRGLKMDRTRRTIYSISLPVRSHCDHYDHWRQAGSHNISISKAIQQPTHGLSGRHVWDEEEEKAVGDKSTSSATQRRLTLRETHLAGRSSSTPMGGRVIREPHGDWWHDESNFAWGKRRQSEYAAEEREESSKSSWLAHSSLAKKVSKNKSQVSMITPPPAPHLPWSNVPYYEGGMYQERCLSVLEERLQFRDPRRRWQVQWKKCRLTVAHDTLSTWSVQWGLNLEGGRSIGDERIFWGPKSS